MPAHDEERKDGYGSGYGQAQYHGQSGHELSSRGRDSRRYDRPSQSRRV
jgi:hypothetical protein